MIELPAEADTTQKAGRRANLLYFGVESTPVELLPIKIPAFDCRRELIELVELGVNEKRRVLLCVGFSHPLGGVQVFDVAGGTSSITIPAM